MKQKIRKIVTAALLSMAVLGMSVPALSASAATGSVNDCDHPYVVVQSSTFLGYTNASATEHQVAYRKVYVCGKCGVFRNEQVERYPEPHRQASSGSLYCVCGYYLH